MELFIHKAKAKFLMKVQGINYCNLSCQDLQISPAHMSSGGVRQVQENNCSLGLRNTLLLPAELMAQHQGQQLESLPMVLTISRLCVNAQFSCSP